MWATQGAPEPRRRRSADRKQAHSRPCRQLGTGSRLTLHPDDTTICGGQGLLHKVAEYLHMSTTLRVLSIISKLLRDLTRWVCQANSNCTFCNFPDFFSLDIFALPVDTEDRLYSDGSLLCGCLQAYTPDTWTTQVWKHRSTDVCFFKNKYTVGPVCAYVEAADAKGWLKGMSASLDFSLSGPGLVLCGFWGMSVQWPCLSLNLLNYQPV